ncbi:hypothetical protein FACS189487_05740 [Campylobacterota bacterium]|nr:hypothetical protein FACS189487_05740 [Campylobacterota bacterium]
MYNCAMEQLEDFVRFVFDAAGEVIADDKVSQIAVEIVRHYRAGSIDIPNYKSNFRDSDILAEYRNRLGKQGHDYVVRDLAAQYFLSPKYVADIINRTKQQSLF